MIDIRAYPDISYKVVLNLIYKYVLSRFNICLKFLFNIYIYLNKKGLSLSILLVWLCFCVVWVVKLLSFYKSKKLYLTIKLYIYYNFIFVTVITNKL